MRVDVGHLEVCDIKASCIVQSKFEFTVMEEITMYHTSGNYNTWNNRIEKQEKTYFFNPVQRCGLSDSSHRKYIKLLKSYLSFVHHKW